MKRALLPSIAGLGVALFAASAHAQVATLDVTNLTNSGGDPVYSVATDVVFTNLTVTETFNNNSTATLNLFDLSDPTHIPLTQLDSTTLVASSDPFNLNGIKSFTVTGMFDTTAMDSQTTFGGSTVPYTVDSNFTATLSSPTLNQSINIFASVNGVPMLAVGTFSLTPLAAAPAVPEPSAFVLAAACGVGLVSAFARRRSRRS